MGWRRPTSHVIACLCWLGFAGIAGSSVDTSNNGLGHFEVDYILIKAAGLPEIKVDFKPLGPPPDSA